MRVLVQVTVLLTAAAAALAAIEGNYMNLLDLFIIIFMKKLA